MSISFPYKKEKVGNAYILRPKIPVTLSWNGKSIEMVMLIDSGSDFSSIPIEIAETLGLVISEKSREVVGFGGTAKVKMSQVNMTIENTHAGRVPIEITYQTELDIPVIGRIPLFHIFDITFKENSNRIILTKVLRR